MGQKLGLDNHMIGTIILASLSRIGAKDDRMAITGC